ncbi:amidohydrolase family protein [Ruminococcus sp. SR1/5]|uniref:amidohydrolase family protein n=1 Tax=Ruminococcus sp. SR1/5 TaxID=657323 RepID=UPI0027422E93|nr:amidohydrolase family protein [Ruminococcus sp. SR1/5]
MTWLYCRGWNEEHFDKPRYPHKDELDALSTEIPIIMVRVCGHVAVCNSCGLELLKKSRSSRRLRRRLTWIPDF